MAISHRTGVIRQIVNALRKTFDTGYPEQVFRDIYVGGEFQMELSRYPAIIVRYQERTIRNMGLGHYVVDEEGDELDRRYQQWYFEGTLIFTIIGRSTYERDLLMDHFVDVVGPGKYRASTAPFFEELYDDDFIILNANVENIIPGGVSQALAPWDNADEMLFSGTYTLDVNGEFFSDLDTSELISITNIDVYPYRPDQELPVGAEPDNDNWV
jgi:hypothetical protein